MFALTNVVLARAEAFRYALSVRDWPPCPFGDWAQAVEQAGRRWSAWAEDRAGAYGMLEATEDAPPVHESQPGHERQQHPLAPQVLHRGPGSRTTDTASDPPGFVHPSGHSSHPFMWSNAGGQRFQVKYHV